jgi:hypothetical protein
MIRKNGALARSTAVEHHHACANVRLVSAVVLARDSLGAGTLTTFRPLPLFP